MKARNLPFLILNVILFSYLLVPQVAVSQTGTRVQPTSHTSINKNAQPQADITSNVVWQSWSEKTVEQSTAESKMIFVTVFPNNCENCENIETEILENPEVISLLNENFIPLKVNSVEQPDFEKAYKKILKKEQENKPINILATPDGQPFWVGSFESTDECLKAIKYFSNESKTNPDKMKVIAAEFAGRLESLGITAHKSLVPSTAELNSYSQLLLEKIDLQNGGIQDDNKYHLPANYAFLLRNYYRTGEEDMMDAVELTLKKMAESPIYDKTNGGFYQYSKGGNWSNPHHQKSLYVNAQLVTLYTEAYQLTSNQTYKDIVYKTLNFIKNKMTSPEGAFYATIENNGTTNRQVVTGWNAMMLKAYVDAYRTFGEDLYLKMALKNADFLEKNMLKKFGHILHIYEDGMARQDGFLDDYAMTVEGFVNLYQATFDEKYLYSAKNLVDYTLRHFYSVNSQTFFYSSTLADYPLNLHQRPVDEEDDVLPSANSAMANGLYLLGTYFYQDGYVTLAEQMLNQILPKMKNAENPHKYANWAILYSQFINPPYEVTILGSDYNAVRSELDKNFLPDVLLLGGKEEGTLAMLQGKLVDGQTMIYVCQSKNCKLPTTEVSEALALLRE